MNNAANKIASHGESITASQIINPSNINMARISAVCRSRFRRKARFLARMLQTSSSIFFPDVGKECIPVSLVVGYRVTMTKRPRCAAKKLVRKIVRFAQAGPVVPLAVPGWGWPGGGTTTTGRGKRIFMTSSTLTSMK